MKESLLQRCRLLVENREIIRSEFRWESAFLNVLCAALCVTKDVTADADALRSCNNILKAHTGALSHFRGTAKMALVTLMSFAPDPNEKIERILDIYTKLKELFWASEYLTITASAISDMAAPEQIDSIVQHTRAIYDRMKANHPFLTSGDNSVFAALLALSGLDDRHIEDEMERCYNLLKPKFPLEGNAVQALSQVLALGTESAELKCQKALDLYDHLKANGRKYGRSFELATLGALVLSGVGIEALAQDMMDADDFLKDQKGFGAFGIGSHQRLMYAGILTMCDCMPAAQTLQSAAINGVISLVIAQQVAICSASAAAAAGAAASSS